MLKLDISDMKISTSKTHKRFGLKANGIALEVSCTLQEFQEDKTGTMKKVNDCLLNSLRFIKLYGTMPSPEKTKKAQKEVDKAMDKKLSVWSQTDTGVAVRGNKLPIKEFIPFFS